MNPLTPKWIVLYRGEHPVRFVKNVCGNVYEIRTHEEATQFNTRSDAVVKAREHGIKYAEFSVEPARQTTEARGK